MTKFFIVIIPCALASVAFVYIVAWAMHLKDKSSNRIFSRELLLGWFVHLAVFVVTLTATLQALDSLDLSITPFARLLIPPLWVSFLVFISSWGMHLKESKGKFKLILGWLIHGIVVIILTYTFVAFVDIHVLMDLMSGR